MAERRDQTKNTIIEHGVRDAFSCGHCLQHEDDMEMARALPCFHVYCTPCLEKTIDPLTSEITCNISDCKQRFPGVVVERLPTVTRDSDGNVLRMDHFCDICKSSPRSAEIYCMDCGKKMCADHCKKDEDYQEMMGNKPHKHVSITEYKAAPKQYAKRFCDKHPTEELTKACTLCHKIFCISDGAEILEICSRSQDERQPHAIAPVNEVSKSLKKQLTDEIQPLKERKDQIELNCTKANYELDKVRSRVTSVEAEIKTETKKLEAKVREEGEKTMKEFEKNLEDEACQVDKYIEGQKSDGETVESTLNSAKELLERSHDVDVVENFDTVIDEIKQRLQINAAIEKVYEPRQVDLSKGQAVIDVGMRMVDKEGSSTKRRNSADFDYLEMKQQMLENQITVLSPHEALQLSMARHAYMEAVKSVRTEFDKMQHQSKYGDLDLVWRRAEEFYRSTCRLWDVDRKTFEEFCQMLKLEFDNLIHESEQNKTKIELENEIHRRRAVEQQIDDMSRQFEVKSAELQSSMERSNNDKQSIDNLEAQLVQAKIDLAAYKTKCADLESLVEKSNKEEQIVDNLKAQLAQAKTDSTKSQTDLEVARKDLNAALTNLENLKAESSKLQGKLNTMTSDEEASLKALRCKEFDLTSAQDALREMQNSKNRALENLEKKFQADLRSVVTERDKASKLLEAREQRLDELTKQLEKANADLNVAENNQNAALKNLENLSTEYFKLQEEFNTMSSLKENSNKEIQSLDDLRAQLAQANTDLAKSLDKANTDLEEVGKARDQANQEVENFKTELKNMQSNNDLRMFQAELREMRDKRDKAVKDLETSFQHCNAQARQLQSLRAELVEAKSNELLVRGELSEINAKMRQMGTSNGSERDWMNERQKAQDTSMLLEQAKESLNKEKQRSEGFERELARKKREADAKNLRVQQLEKLLDEARASLEFEKKAKAYDAKAGASQIADARHEAIDHRVEAGKIIGNCGKTIKERVRAFNVLK